VFLAGLTCLLLVDGIQFGVQQEEEEKGPLVTTFFMRKKTIIYFH
jgi:hypothetical protein